MKCQHHPVRKVFAKNAPCIANTVYRKFSNSIIRKDAAPTEGKIEQRSDEEIKKYVEKEIKENWVSYGFYPWDRYKDNVAGQIAFFCVALITVVPIWIYNYTPDYQLKNWAHREAYLLLKEREDAGIFPISKDFLDPEKVNLPSDEELGDIEIRI